MREDARLWRMLRRCKLIQEVLPGEPIKIWSYPNQDTVKSGHALVASRLLMPRRSVKSWALVMTR